MKWFSFCVAGLLTVALLGGGVGCNKGEKHTVEGKKGEKLTLKAPADTSVNQGDTTKIKVSITREKLNDPVKLEFKDLPAAVSIMENDMTIAKDATSAEFNLKAVSDAKLVDGHKVAVIASAADLKVEATFKVSVKKGSGAVAETKSVTVKTPDEVTVKQGDSAKIKVSITREKFDDDVKVKFKDLPEGVSVMESDMTIAKADKNGEFTLKAAPDAKTVDDHKVTVTAWSGTITNDATFKLSIKKK